MCLSKPNIPPDSTLRASTSWTRAPMGLTDIPKPAVFKTRQLSQNPDPPQCSVFQFTADPSPCCLVNAQSRSATQLPSFLLPQILDLTFKYLQALWNFSPAPLLVSGARPPSPGLSHCKNLLTVLPAPTWPTLAGQQSE